MIQEQFTVKSSIVDEILSQIPSHVFWKDKDGVYLGCNALFASSFDLTPVEIIGKTDFDLSINTIDAENFRQDDTEVITQKLKKINIEEKQTLPDGSERYLLTSKVPLLDSNDKVVGILGVYSDITDKKILEKELKAALNEAQIAEAEREKTLRLYTQFINDQEHDIRTPLGGVAAGTSLLLPMIKSDPDEALAVLEMVNRSATEILDYQESLLYDLYQDEREGYSIFTRFDLADIVQRVYHANEAAAKIKGLTYTVDFDNSIPAYLLGNGKYVYQCLLDLLSNAVRFTQHGSVTLTAERISQTERQVVVRFTVTDTGIGIPKDRQIDIHHAFVKVLPSDKGGQRGRGLGLTRVNAYATKMDGELRFNSEVGKGSCFKLVLPFKISLDQTEST